MHSRLLFFFAKGLQSLHYILVVMLNYSLGHSVWRRSEGLASSYCMVASASYHGLLEHLYPEYGSTQTYRAIPHVFHLLRKADLGRAVNCPRNRSRGIEQSGLSRGFMYWSACGCFPLILKDVWK